MASTHAFPITQAMSLTARIASSFAGMMWSTSSGSQFVSTIPNTGILSLRASNTAFISFLGSTTKIASGSLFMSLIPPKNFSKRSRSLIKFNTSFLGSLSNMPSSSILYNDLRRRILNLIVLKLVSVPPNQR